MKGPVACPCMTASYSSSDMFSNVRSRRIPALLMTMSHDPNSSTAVSITWMAEAWSDRSEEHTSELQSLMLTSYAVFCLNKKNTRSLENIRDIIERSHIPI